jgi:large subunit ribosomal protein L24
MSRFKNKLHIKKGDMVVMISGNHKYGPDNKATHRVLEVFPEDQTAIVEGVHIVSKHTKPNAKNTQGGIVKTAAAEKKNALLDPKDGKPTRRKKNRERQIRSLFVCLNVKS